MNIITNAFTVDVEDYYQVEAFSQHIKRSHWDDFPSHVEKKEVDPIIRTVTSRS